MKKLMGAAALSLAIVLICLPCFADALKTSERFVTIQGNRNFYPIEYFDAEKNSACNRCF